MKRFEECTECGQRTGRAGRGDDSLYSDDGYGPYCWGCFCNLEIKTSDRMPDLHEPVRVAGGTAVWTGSVWLSQNPGDDFARVIEWPVTWWKHQEE